MSPQPRLKSRLEAPLLKSTTLPRHCKDIVQHGPAIGAMLHGLHPQGSHPNGKPRLVVPPSRPYIAKMSLVCFTSAISPSSVAMLTEWIWLAL